MLGYKGKPHQNLWASRIHHIVWDHMQYTYVFIKCNSYIQAVFTDLHQECPTVCPLLCQHPQWKCIWLFGQDHQYHARSVDSMHHSHILWRGLICHKVHRKPTRSPDGGWVGSNWHGQFCCCSRSPPSHCSQGQWVLDITYEGVLVNIDKEKVRSVCKSQVTQGTYV